MNRKITLLSLVVAIVLGVFAIGCGGGNSDGDTGSSDASSSDEASVHKVAEQLAKVTLAKDAKGFCALFAPRQIEKWLGNLSCVQVFGVGLRNPVDKSQFKIDKVKVDGDKATVTFGYGDVGFTKVDGKWYLDVPETKAPLQSDS